MQKHLWNGVKLEYKFCILKISTQAKEVSLYIYLNIDLFFLKHLKQCTNQRFSKGAAVSLFKFDVPWIIVEENIINLIIIN